MRQKITKQIFADILGTSKRVVDSWIKQGKITLSSDPLSDIKYIPEECLKKFDELEFFAMNYD